MLNETKLELRNRTFERVCDMLRPWCGRIIAEWRDKKKNAIYVFLICSRERDAGTPEDPRHQWRGTMTVNITNDGSPFFSIDEHLVYKAIRNWSELGVMPVCTWPDSGTWEATELLLKLLTPPLDPIPESVA